MVTEKLHSFRNQVFCQSVAEPWLRSLKANSSYKTLRVEDVLDRVKAKIAETNEELRAYGLEFVPATNRIVVIDPQRAGSLPAKVAPGLLSGNP